MVERVIRTDTIRILMLLLYKVIPDNFNCMEEIFSPDVLANPG
jgi:hypothetical protein